MTSREANDSRPPDSLDLPHPAASEVRACGRLIGLIRRLRGPGGCAWDAKQTLRTMTPYLVEEAYEVVDAIERDSTPSLREELGDLVFLLFFCLELAREESRFTIEDALEDHVCKMVGRHPHVFGEVDKLGSGEAARQWEELKQSEKRERSSVLDGRLPTLPALTAAYRVQEKVAAVGFDWERIEEVLDKVEEEISELREILRGRTTAAADDRSGAHAPDPGAETPDGHLRAEIGDVIFALVNLSRFLAVDPEAALRGTIGRFVDRFRHIERRLAENGRTPAGATLAEMDTLWEEAKRLERAGTLPGHGDRRRRTPPAPGQAACRDEAASPAADGSPSRRERH